MRGRAAKRRGGIPNFAGFTCCFVILAVPTAALAHAGNSAASAEEARARDQALEEEAEEAPQPSVRCPDALRLVASVVNEHRPQLSRAMVRNAAGTRMLVVGGWVDDLMLIALQPQFAELRNAAGARCVLPVYDPGARSPSQVASRPAPKPVPARAETPSPEPKARAMFTPDELSRGLRSLGNGTYVLSRALLLKALTNPGGAASGAHFRLAEREGRSLGMEVRGVRDGSVLSRMGLRTGDVVKNVNGVDISNALGLLDLLRSARETDSVTLSVVHEGKERALRYLIE